MKQPKETPPTANDAAPAGRPEETQNRLKEILQVLARHDIVKGMTPEKLRNIVEDLGPTFVKLGQIMSMRQDMLPAAYCRECGAELYGEEWELCPACERMEEK